MLWLIVGLAAYFILAAVFLVDKYLLVSSVPNPKVYSFYIGVLGFVVLFLIPFIDFYVLSPIHLFWSFVSGAAFILGLFWFFNGLKAFETSRMAPAVGGMLPIFTFFLVYSFSGGQEALSPFEMLSFVLLVLGSVLITYEKEKNISWKSLKLSAAAAFFFAVSFVSAKYVYLEYPFWLGLVWIRLFGAGAALAFLLSRQTRKDVLKQGPAIQKKTVAIFFSSQAAGAAAGILQNWAIALAPLAHIAFVNALQGAQYVFLLALALVLSLKFPNLLKEEVSRKALLQKALAVALIGSGLLILSLK